MKARKEEELAQQRAIEKKEKSKAFMERIKQNSNKILKAKKEQELKKVRLKWMLTCAHSNLSASRAKRQTSEETRRD